MYRCVKTLLILMAVTTSTMAGKGVDCVTACPPLGCDSSGQSGSVNCATACPQNVQACKAIPLQPTETAKLAWFNPANVGKHDWDSHQYMLGADGKYIKLPNSSTVTLSSVGGWEAARVVVTGLKVTIQGKDYYFTIIANRKNQLYYICVQNPSLPMQNSVTFANNQQVWVTAAYNNDSGETIKSGGTAGYDVSGLPGYATWSSAAGGPGKYSETPANKAIPVGLVAVP